MRRTVLLLCFFLALAAPLFAQDDTQIMPADNAVSGWKKVEAPRRFTHADLYGYIDGGAELFLEFGFEQLTVQKYRNGGNDVTVEAYRMTDSPAALGVYLMKAGKETPLPSFKERHTANKYQLMFCRNRYFVIINNLSGSEAVAPAKAAFAASVAAKLAPASPVAGLDALPRQGLIRGSARLVRGPYGLQSVFTLGEGDILQLERKVTATCGDYKTADGSYSLILASYPDAAHAKRAFDYLKKNLDQYLTIVDQRPDGFVFEDYAKKFGVAAVSGRTLQVKVKLGKRP